MRDARSAVTAFLVSAVALLVALPGCKPTESGKSVDTILEPFAGDWVVVSLDRSGKGSSSQALKDITVSVEKDRFMMVEVGAVKSSAGSTSSREVHTSVYALQVDPAQPDGEINFAYASGESLGQVRAAIYAFEGDTLKICM